MKQKEFKKLKVGDKVRIIADAPKNADGDTWNNEGRMNKWLGKVMTVSEITSEYAKMVEDKNEWSDGWYWFPELIAYKIEDKQPVVVKHLIKGRKTIVKLSNGRVGIADCSPEDEFDVYEGLRIATAIAYEKGSDEIFGEDEPKVKEVKRHAKVGEYIKIVEGSRLFTESYKTGDILQVYKQGKCNFGPGVFCHVKNKLDAFSIFINDDGNPIIHDREYVVLEGYKPEPEVKEVKRAAKVGEYIKIVEPYITAGLYKKGDILKVNNANKSNGDVYCDGIRLLRMCHVIKGSEYVVLEGYKPEKK